MDARRLRSAHRLPNVLLRLHQAERLAEELERRLAVDTES